MHKAAMLVALLLLSGCGQRVDLAPVESSRPSFYNKTQSTHVVRKGETLYAIAFRYDKDYHELAAYNHLRDPYALRIGQVLQLKPKQQSTKSRKQVTRRANKASVRTLKRQSISPRYKQSKVSSVTGKHWYWPVKGRIVSGFSPKQGKKGIDIAGKKGDRVRASKGGVIAYSGNGLPGYGNLIIIKHDHNYLTAYGHNLRNLVKEGQRVKAGQVIAMLGRIHRRKWGVHFELRKTGQPINPMVYLKKNK